MIGLIKGNLCVERQDGRSRNAACVENTHMCDTHQLPHTHTLLRYTQNVWPGVTLLGPVKVVRDGED